MEKFRVINFHGIGTPCREMEPGEEPYWISEDRYRFILDRVVANPERDSIAITFDDGNRSDLEIGLPELIKRGLTAEFFILSGRLGSTGFLDADGVRALLDAGMKIGSHGVAHVDWTAVPPETLREELAGSKSALEEICGQPVRSASAPFGRYNATVLEAALAAGYEHVYSSNGGVMETADFLRARTSIRRETTDAKLEAILSDNPPLLGRLRRSLGRIRRSISIRLKQFG